MKEKIPNYKITLIILGSYIVICGLLVIYWIIGDIKGANKNLDLDFAGKVERIEYDIKQFPTIIVNDSTYYIGSGYNTGHQIEIGDSIIKRKGSEVYTLIKRKSHKIVEFRK